MNDQKTGKVITFYSYKGGVGRTMALANIGALLATWGHKVLCIDWDLEAPGLSTYFRAWMEHPLHKGLTEWITAYADGGEPDWRDFITKVTFKEHHLDFMTAGLHDDSYLSRMQKISWERFYSERSLGLFLEDSRKQWLAEYDFILVDSRTGVTDTSGICTVQLPDIMVALMTANEQSLSGCLDVMRRATQMRMSLPFDREQITILPIITRFEFRVEYEQSQQWFQRFSEALKPLLEQWVPRHTKPEDVLYHLRIPYIPYWSFGERLPVIEKGTSDPDDIGYSLETLAALVAQHLENSNLLINRREYFVSKGNKKTTSKLPKSPSKSLEKIIKKSESEINKIMITMSIPIEIISNNTIFEKSLDIVKYSYANGFEDVLDALLGE
jgi:cellulose biosynthesis protein BcsQ